MKNITFLLLILFGATFKLSAQPPMYDDLLIMYADGNYEKLLKEAEKYTQKDDSKKDALPFYYLAKCNFEMSKDQKWAEKYPKAANDAVRYAGNCIKKDKEGTVYEENLDFFTDLKISVVEDIRNMVDGGQYAKLMGGISKLHRFDSQDVGSYFLKAAAQYQEKDKGGAKLSAEEAYKRLDEVTNADDWRLIDKEMLKIGVIEYCNAQINIMRLTEPAKDLLGRVKQWLENDEEFMAYYNQVVN